MISFAWLRAWLRAWMRARPRGGRWRVRFNSDWRGYSSAFTDRPSFDTVALQGGNGDNMPFGGDIGLGPYTAIILSQDD